MRLLLNRQRVEGKILSRSQFFLSALMSLAQQKIKRPHTREMESTMVMMPAIVIMIKIRWGLGYSGAFVAFFIIHFFHACVGFVMA